MTSTVVSESAGKMALLSRWIPFIFLLIVAVVMGQQTLDGLWQDVYHGLSSPLLNMNHVMFLLMASSVSFGVVKRPFELVVLGIGAALGVLAYCLWGYIPGARLLSGLSLLFLLLIHWNPDRIGSWSTSVIGISALAHGIWYGEALTDPGAWDRRLVFILVLTAMQLSLGFAWGSLIRFLRNTSESAYEGLEHLLVATAAGTALVYIYWGLFKQV